MTSRTERSSVVVRPATPADLDFTARTHREHLPHGLFPLLGPAFMKRWHRTFVSAPDGVALVAVSPGETGEDLVGFIVGATDQAALVEHVLRDDKVQLGVVGAGSLLLRPRLALHFVRTRGRAYARRLLGRARPAPTPDGSPGDHDPTSPRRGRPPPVAVVTALVVVPEARGSGAGAALVTELVALAATAGTAEARLTTLAGADGAGSFYEALGWQRQGAHATRDGVLVETYSLDLG